MCSSMRISRAGNCSGASSSSTGASIETSICRCRLSRTEFSASFDSLNYDGTVRHFGDRASFAATCVLYDGKKLDIAIAPTASFLLRGDRGLRYGATAIAR